jgi:nicotinate-nucleotide--dimethylbenzimidazole phosphoribosyltransferase
VAQVPCFGIRPLASDLTARIVQTIDAKTKPVGALGRLEELAARICVLQNTLHPTVASPHIVVFAGDHGIVQEGVSAYPQSVTYQMVYNFLAGGAAINVFARLYGITLQIVDAGVNHDFGSLPGLVQQKIAKGTENFLYGPAMTQSQCLAAIARGADRVREIHHTGCNVIGFGEMGIGNTSAAAILTSLLCGLPLQVCVGRGAGLDDSGLAHKLRILEAALQRWPGGSDPFAALSHYGGFEIAMMCGAFLQAASAGMLILVDGFIATAALLVAYRFEPALLDYCIFSHLSAEQGHIEQLRCLRAEPLLRLEMRLGEGSGAALALPLVRAAVHFMNEMASFAAAGVSGQKGA